MHRVFVFPSCNEPGLEAVQALSKSNKIRLYGGSSGEPRNDPSFSLLKNHVQCPWYEAEDFQARFLRLMEEHNIDLVLPCWDPLLPVFASWASARPRFATAPAGTCQLLLSKRRTYQALGAIVPCPEILEESDAAVYPAFAKPDQGSGSKGSFIIEYASELETARKRDLLVTEYLPGEEYTVDCFNDLGGRLLLAHVRARTVIGRGIALVSRSVHRPELEAHCHHIAQAIPIHGPWFAQFKENRNGEPVLLEVNARIGGSMGLTRHAGANIPLMSVFLFMGAPVRVPAMMKDIRITRNLTLQATTATPFVHVIWDLDDTLLKPDGQPDPEAMACLFDCHNRGLKQYLMTKNPEAHAILAQTQTPQFFREICITEDKVTELGSFFARHSIRPEDTILVNDSYAERFAMEKAYPALRIITPDALSVLKNV